MCDAPSPLQGGFAKVRRTCESMTGGHTVPKVQITPNRPIYPTPAALITSVDAAGRPNIITLGEVFNISIRQPVILGIAHA